MCSNNIGNFGRQIAIYDKEINELLNKYKRNDTQDIKKCQLLSKLINTSPHNESIHLDKNIETLKKIILNRIFLLKKQYKSLLILLEYINGLDNKKSDCNCDCNKIGNQMKLIEDNIQKYSLLFNK